MRNFPNIYTSFNPGMLKLTGVPGSFVNLLKKVLVTGTDPVAFTSITVLSGVATLTGVVEDEVFLNGSRIGITGCSEPLLNGVFEVEDHNKYQTSFITTVADGTYGGSIQVNLPPAGWNLLFTGTNDAVFVSGNLDTLGVCVRVIDTNALYATLEFYENMTAINSGINKFNSSIWGASRVVRVFKSFNATTIPINFWIAADNTTMHFSNERINTVDYTPHKFDGFRGGLVISFGEMQAVESFNKKHFYFIGDYSLSTDTLYPGAYGSFMLNNSLSPGYFNSETYISSCVLSPNSGGSAWRRIIVNASDFMNSGRRVSGSNSKIVKNIKLSPFYYLSEFYSLTLESSTETNYNFFGKIKETCHLNQQVSLLVRNGTKVQINGKNYICLPIYSPDSAYSYLEVNAYQQGCTGILPFLIGEKWGD